MTIDTAAIEAEMVAASAAAGRIADRRERNDAAYAASRRRFEVGAHVVTATLVLPRSRTTATRRDFKPRIRWKLDGQVVPAATVEALA